MAYYIQKRPKIKLYLSKKWLFQQKDKKKLKKFYFFIDIGILKWYSIKRQTKKDKKNKQKQADFARKKLTKKN